MISDANVSLCVDDGSILSNISDFGRFSFDFKIASFEVLKQAGYYYLSVGFGGNDSHEAAVKKSTEFINIFEYITWDIVKYDDMLSDSGGKIRFEANLHDQDNRTMNEYPFSIRLDYEGKEPLILCVKETFGAGFEVPVTFTGNYSIKGTLQRDKYSSSSSALSSGYQASLYLPESDDDSTTWLIYGKLIFEFLNVFRDLSLSNWTEIRERGGWHIPTPQPVLILIRSLVSTAKDWLWNVNYMSKLLLYIIQAIFDSDFSYEMFLNAIVLSIIVAVNSVLTGDIEKFIFKYFMIYLYKFMSSSDWWRKNGDFFRTFILLEPKLESLKADPKEITYKNWDLAPQGDIIKKLKKALLPDLQIILIDFIFYCRLFHIFNNFE
jgi:hypothetical protein